jgi:hypothetical protein
MHLQKSSIKVRNQKLFTFFLFKCFSKLVEITGYLIATRGTESPLIKYDRKRLIIIFSEQQRASNDCTECTNAANLVTSPPMNEYVHQTKNKKF